MSDRTIRVAAHAKINLILRVLEQESSGYHRIETLFQRLALADDITVRATEAGRALDVEWPDSRPMSLGEVERNLAWRAAAAYRDAAGWPNGWEIRLAKRIPAGAGLGGGSSDAAAVLRALDALASAPLPASILNEVGATLGSDVPFFLSDASLAIGRGRGDVLVALAPLPTADVVLVVPGFSISTAEAYKQFTAARARTRAAPPTAIFRDSDDFSSWGAIGDRQANHFEATVFSAYPELEAYRETLARAGATIARLSGSGSTVFGVWPSGFGRGNTIVAPPQSRILVTSTA